MFKTIISIAICIPSVCTPATRDPFARSVQVDSSFAYYQNRSKQSIASEIGLNGYRCIRLIVTDDTSPDADLVNACHDAGTAVWYTSFGNGKYGTAGLPAGWEHWKMVLRASQPDGVAGGYVYLCLNNPDYRAWKTRTVTETLKSVPFDGFEMAEPFWPAYRGPESAAYGCLCGSCRSAFLDANPEESDIPDFRDQSSSRYYKTDRDLYRKWVDFRAESVLAFHREIIDAVRKARPEVRIAVWGIADDVPNPVESLREWEGIDGKALASAIKPDVYVIQTDWPEWTKPELPVDYPLKYRPFVTAVKSASPRTRIILQTDIGSHEDCRRGSAWIAECESAAAKAGMRGLTAYEYHLSADIYDRPPRLLAADVSAGLISLKFDKRLDSAGAADPANYSPNAGRVIAAKADGSIVQLTIEGRPTKIIVRDLSDDPSRRLFKGYPVLAMSEPSTVFLEWK